MEGDDNMMFPCWVTPSADALAQIILSEEEYPGSETPFVPTEAQEAAAIDALETAQGILSALTSGIHGSGTAIDEFAITSPVRRLSTTFRPLSAVLSIVTDDGVTAWDADWDQIGQTIYVQGNYVLGVPMVCGPRVRKLRLTYRFGSTVTTAARTTLLYYARQIYLAGPLGNLDECQLPERVVSINREGISMSLVDPQNFLDRGRTGVTRVDQWLASHHGRTGLRSSGVFSADCPPPLNVSVECA